MVKRGAAEFTRNQILPVLEARDVDSALWWRERPASRAGMSPDDVRKRISDPNQAQSGAMFEVIAGPIVTLINELKEHPGANVAFERVDHAGVDGLTPFAVAVVRIYWREDHDEHEDGQKHEESHEHRGDFAAVLLKMEREGKREHWWVEDYVYPYTAATYKVKERPVDDGHGHAH
jgi:hypothetical protein